MSSTNRGGKIVPGEFYRTPEWATKALLKTVHLPNGNWLEPSAGDGAIIKAVNESKKEVTWTAIELEPDFQSKIVGKIPRGTLVIGDFLSKAADDHLDLYDVAIMNPPFSLTVEFVKKCKSIAKHVVLLQKLNWLGTATRCEFFQKDMPDVYVLSKRPFPDSVEYGWFVWHKWDKGSKQNTGLIQVLDIPETDGAKRVNKSKKSVSK